MKVMHHGITCNQQSHTENMASQKALHEHSSSCSGAPISDLDSDVAKWFRTIRKTIYGSCFPPSPCSHVNRQYQCVDAGVCVFSCVCVCVHEIARCKVARRSEWFPPVNRAEQQTRQRAGTLPWESGDSILSTLLTSQWRKQRVKDWSKQRQRME